VHAALVLAAGSVLTSPRKAVMTTMNEYRSIFENGQLKDRGTWVGRKTIGWGGRTRSKWIRRNLYPESVSAARAIAVMV
jgi:hypothetical protein